MRSSKTLSRLSPFLYLLPSFVFLAVFTYYPMITSIYNSFHKWNLAFIQPTPTGFDNYRLIFDTPLFWRVVQNNIIYSVGTIVVALVLAMLLALLLNRALGLIGLYRLSVFYPTMIPMAAAAMIWAWLLAPGYGLINHLLVRFGIQEVAWLTTEPYALYALIAVGIWKNVGYYAVILLAGLQNISDELIEAATLEGANGWQRFWRIVFPLLAPTTFFVTIMAVINSFQSIDQVYMMTSGGPANSTNLFLYYIWQNGFLFWDIGYASALTTLLLLALLVLTVIAFRSLESRIHYSE